MQRSTLYAAALTCVAAVIAGACSDAELLMPDRQEVSIAVAECTADTDRMMLTCRAQAGVGKRDFSAAIFGQNQMKMASSNLVGDTVAQTFAVDVTTQNLLTYPVGTPDGVTKTGLKV
ncbi:MAG TPA: hypothetical protein VF665_11125, partial [Longimicrobium sp.]|uniref:hypothetical protein n=1 Tax=Longimicrobium sp. TaxID=2029185 RepID=UPI002ED950F8